MSRLTIFLFVIITLLIGLSFGRFRQYVQNTLIPPIELVGAPYLHLGDGKPFSTYHPGQAVFVHTHTRRISECTVTIAYSILESRMDADGVFHRRFWQSYRVTMNSTSVGVFDTDERRIIPVWLPPGAYFFSRYALYDCDGIKIEHKTPPIAFQVILPIMNDRGMD